jgi:N-acetylneuraminate synthase/N,N'-diacetyllegionaminate synthase
MLVSLGMWDEQEFPRVESAGPVEFLYCVSKYPTLLTDLAFLQVDFRRYSGFSDHTIGINAALIALARGARVLEKHFTLDKSMHGPDHAGSMTPDELAAIHAFREDLKQCLQ